MGYEVSRSSRRVARFALLALVLGGGAALAQPRGEEPAPCEAAGHTGKVVGGLLGALIGGKIGAELGGEGDSRRAAAAAGGVLGALLGTRIGREFDRDDKDCQLRAQEPGPAPRRSEPLPQPPHDAFV